MKNPGKNLKLTALGAMFAAMVCVTTAYLFHIPVGMNGGYIHLGDAFIYLAAAFLPWPYAISAAAIGAATAAILTGAAVWAIPTMIIKALMVLPFTSRSPKILGVRNLAAVILSGIICIGGYYLAEGWMYGSWLVSFAGIWPGFLQSGGGGLLFLLLGAALDKADMKQRLLAPSHN